MGQTKKQLEWIELFNEDYIEFAKNKQKQNQGFNKSNQNQKQNATGGLQK